MNESKWVNSERLYVSSQVRQNECTVNEGKTERVRQIQKERMKDSGMNEWDKRE